jgi:hypothetical protein
MNEDGTVVYRLTQLEVAAREHNAKLEKFFEELRAERKAEAAERAAMALRVDRLEQRAALASKAVGALALTVLALVADALRALF